MAINEFDNLNDLHLDVLREIGNIGSGNAASALAMMLNQKINIAVPTIRILDYTEVAYSMGGPENMVAALLVYMGGSVTGMLMYILENDFATNVLNALLGQSYADISHLDEFASSAVTEISNIMISSYVNAISDMTTLDISLSAPELCIDMVGAILSVPAINYANISDKIFLIEDEFIMEEQSVVSRMLMIPEVDSLNDILTKLGIEI